jgi:branched-chain amino acid transport system permease protein
MASTETVEQPVLSASAERNPASAAALHRIIFIALAAALIAAPFLLYPFFLMKVLCFALFACAFNLLLGYGGLLSFGHAMFFGFASYITAHTAKVGLDITVPGGLGLISIPPFSTELAIIAGALVAGLLGLLSGLLAIRRQGIYFAMITLALAQMVYFYSLQAPFTGGENGIQAVPRGMLFGVADLENDAVLYYFVAAVFFAGLLFIYRIVHSPFGQILKAIRDNEPRAISLGYRTNQYKLAVFVLSATLAGLAGAVKAIVFQLATLTDVHWSMSGEVILMTLVGGMGTIFGPIAGALVIVSMQNYLANLGAWVTIIQGIIFVVCVLLFREGIVGVISRYIGRPL